MEGHGKVISKSRQGQISWKRSKIAHFCCFMLQLRSHAYDGLKLTQTPTRTYTKTLREL